MKTFEERIVEINDNVNLDLYLSDPSYDVRVAVAKKGYGLEKLITDPDEMVIIAAVTQIISIMYRKE